MADSISVLIVDDSALMRNLIGKIIEGAPDLVVFNKAMNGVFALKKMEKDLPDIIVLDLEMPEMNGIEFLRERKKRGIKVPVVILSSIARKGAQITMEALSLGASDFIMKPSGSISEDIHIIGDHLIAMLRAYSGKKKSSASYSQEISRQVFNTTAKIDTKSTSRIIAPRRGTPLDFNKLPQFEPKRKVGALEIIAFGISTGGPNALRLVFSEISKNLSLPIVVVQHMPEGFTEEFAKSLDRICPLEVKEAKDGDVLKPGRILIAQGNKHMIVEKKSLVNVVRLLDSDPVNGHRPSVDVLFESVSRIYQNRAMGVIMTGMGKDGARQIGSIYHEGGLTIAQDEESSIVYGMPRVAIENNYIQEVVSLNNMAERISSIVKENLFSS